MLHVLNVNLFEFSSLIMKHVHCFFLFVILSSLLTLCYVRFGACFRGSLTQRERVIHCCGRRKSSNVSLLTPHFSKENIFPRREDVQTLECLPSCIRTDICSQAFPDEFFVQSIVNNFQNDGCDTTEYDDQVSFFNVWYVDLKKSATRKK